jgi:hypothetical protein
MHQKHQRAAELQLLLCQLPPGLRRKQLEAELAALRKRWPASRGTEHGQLMAMHDLAEQEAGR